jgi:hypothetical protein
MFQRLNFLIYFVSLYLNRRKARALIEQVQASNLNDAARDRLLEILRFMLRLPEETAPESSPPPPSLRSRSTPARQAKRPSAPGDPLTP